MASEDLGELIQVLLADAGKRIDAVLAPAIKRVRASQRRIGKEDQR